MQAIAEGGHAVVAAVSDPSPDAARQAADAARAVAGHPADVAVVDSLDALLELGLDGVVIATPSALHADQAVRALERGAAVFCQKPLARTAAESRRVVDAARAADRLLGVDLSYRHTAGVRAVRELVRARGARPRLRRRPHVPQRVRARQAVVLRPRARRRRVRDRPRHPPRRPRALDARLAARRRRRVAALQQGASVRRRRRRGRGLRVATLDLDGGAVVRLACSWHLPAGRDAVIEAAFYGDQGGAAFRNVGGSFYDFAAERFRGTAREPVAPEGAGGSEPWGGRAAAAWAARLAESPAFDPEVERVVDVAAALDAVYGRRG
jgi:predicted dehydrogenase